MGRLDTLAYTQYTETQNGLKRSSGQSKKYRQTKQPDARSLPVGVVNFICNVSMHRFKKFLVVILMYHHILMKSDVLFRNSYKHT